MDISIARKRDSPPGIRRGGFSSRSAPWQPPPPEAETVQELAVACALLWLARVARVWGGTRLQPLLQA
eukprot:7615147-Pyramimonas_sp.AAC.1